MVYVVVVVVDVLSTCDGLSRASTIDSQVIERWKWTTKFLGRRTNIKITEKHDFDLLNKFITRGGIGFDLHKYQEGSGIILGGYMLECNLQIIAHSDGDVLLHSIADSILGASGQGDIGKYFSDQDPKNEGIDDIFAQLTDEIDQMSKKEEKPIARQS